MFPIPDGPSFAVGLRRGSVPTGHLDRSEALLSPARWARCVLPFVESWLDPAQADCIVERVRLSGLSVPQMVLIVRYVNMLMPVYGGHVRLTVLLCLVPRDVIGN